MRINNFRFLHTHQINDDMEYYQEFFDELKDNHAELFRYLLEAYDELRNELKMRIQQRDNLAIQFIVISGVLAGIAFTDYKYAYFSVLIIPLMTLFFAIQIFSSYEVHDRLVEFIREHIEVELGRTLGIDENRLYDYFWEQYCKKDRELHNVKMPGGRKGFFQCLLKMVPFFCSVAFFFLCYTSSQIEIKWNLLISITTLVGYVVWGQYYLYRFNVKPKKIENEKLSKCDYKKKIVNIKKLQRAVFFDRDGTIHVDKVETTLEKGLELFPDTISTLKTLKKRGYRIIIVTNQSGIAKGHITYEQMHKFNKALLHKFYKKFCFIDAIYYCPHQKKDNCNCAKPKTGMFERAIREFNIDINKSYMVGDKIGDIKAAKNIGIPQKNRLFITTGIYENNDYSTEPNIDKLKPEILNDLSSILNVIK